MSLPFSEATLPGTLEDMGEHIGEMIRALREQQGVGKVEMGRRLGVSYQMVTHIEEHAEIRAQRLLQICQALGVPLSHFLGDQVRELEGQAGLSPEEQAWVELRRQLAADGRLEEAERLLHLDEEGRRLIAVHWSLPPEGRRRLVREARKLEIDFEGVGPKED